MGRGLYKIFNGEPTSLSPNQLKVVVLIAKGQRLRDISAALGMSKSTAWTHKSEALTRLRLKTNTELVRWAFIHGLIH